MVKRHLAVTRQPPKPRPSTSKVMKIKKPEGVIRKHSETMCYGSQICSMNKNVKTSVEREPEQESDAEKEKQIIEKPRRKTQMVLRTKGVGLQDKKNT